jgi:aminopeptidase N
MTLNMKNLLFLLILPFLSIAQEGGEMCSHFKSQAFANARKASQNYFPGDNTINVTFHKLDLNINHTNKNIRGSVSTKFKPLVDLNSVYFNLNTALKVDSILFESKKLVFTHTNNKINLTFTAMLLKDKIYEVTIYYGGVPPNTAFGSFSSSTHGTEKSPVIWSLSEPYGAPDWWPCKDDLTDKVDSSTVAITMDSFFTSVSNGVLISEKTNTNGSKTYIWKNKYPIAHYLISVACTNYGLYEQTFEWNGKKMPVKHYVYPEILNATTKIQLDRTTDMLKFFSETFGEYPFINEKYGHAQCNFGGGMEHQTVSSMGGFGESLVAHELAHQWFGDKITCKTWADIFVNEAFASYSEALWRENKNGKADYKTVINTYVVAAKKVTESIYISNPANENLIFNYNLTYGKGAVVLHMLRGVLGDVDFFKTLKAYMASEYAYGPATIGDFRLIAEKTTGKDLKAFFDQWTSGTNYPKYSYTWGQSATKEITVTIKQDKLSTTPALFKMPIQLKAKFTTGSDSTFTVQMDVEEKVFVIKNLKAIPTELLFDPEELIMKEVQFLGRKDIVGGQITLANEPIKNKAIVFPNPVSSILQLENEVEQYAISDLAGKILIQKNGKTKTILIGHLNAGTYFLQTLNEGKRVAFKFVKL